MPVKVTLYLDDREVCEMSGTGKERKRTVTNVPAPLKLRVYVDRDNIKHYRANLNLTYDDFQNSYLAARPRGDLKNLKTTIEGIKIKADSVIKHLGDNFTFNDFGNQLYKSSTQKVNVITYFADYIALLDGQGRAATSDLYRLSINSITNFYGNEKPIAILPFKAITVEFLENYERWFLAKGNSKTSIGMYLRNLRAIFNIAIGKGDVPGNLYPFGKGGYKIPSGTNVKKAVSNDSLKSLHAYKPTAGSPAELALDYWFFSFQCNGMNFRDIAELKFKDIHGTYFSFVRHKTARTTKGEIKPIMVPITANINAFFVKYQVKEVRPGNYVFPIFKLDMDEKEKLKVNRNFIRMINNQTKAIAEKLGINVKIRTMAARHSFTTKVTKAVGLEFAQEALGHTSMATTQNYWAGFNDEVKQQVADNLMDFD